MNVIVERSEEIREWTKGYEAEEFTRDEKTKLAAYKAFQEVAESCMDIVAMACKDKKIVPKEDYTNIENLDFIDESIKGVLIEANGLRNRLVHRYNQSDDLVAFVSIKELLPRIEEFVEMIEQWMRKEWGKK
ncbi:MAG TPA: DUF86 domain-containing protein [Methanophagales archaeon]|nr:DUF86 domain-containing protein [Methanophagales archaeon]